MNLDLYRRLVAGESLTHILAGRALWRFTGPDRLRYLNGQVTAEIESVPHDEARLAAVCTAKGRMEGVVYVVAHGNELYLDAPAELREALGARLGKYLIADDAALEDVSDQWSVSHVFGVVPPPQPDTGFVVRHARYGLPGHDVWIAGTGAICLGNNVDSDLVETVRIEHAIPVWGAELTPQTLPPEAGPVMLSAISYTKGCYVGQETIARLKSVGHVNRTLVLLRSELPLAPTVGTRLTLGEKEIGTVTSSAFSPHFQAGVALAYVTPTVAEPGTSLTADALRLTVETPLPTAVEKAR